MYRCACEFRGPNCACCLCNLRASAGDGGWKRVVGGSSIFDASALAVDSDIVGRDSVGLLIPGLDVEFRNACSCALLAAKSAAAALLYLSLSFGVVVKNCAILLGLLKGDDLLPPFSEGEKDGQGIGGELLRILFENDRRGMAEIQSRCLAVKVQENARIGVSFESVKLLCSVDSIICCFVVACV